MKFWVELLPWMPFDYPLTLAPKPFGPHFIPTQNVQCSSTLALQSLQLSHVLICTLRSNREGSNTSTWMPVLMSAPIVLVISCVDHHQSHICIITWTLTSVSFFPAGGFLEAGHWMWPHMFMTSLYLQYNQLLRSKYSHVAWLIWLY